MSEDRKGRQERKDDWRSRRLMRIHGAGLASSFYLIWQGIYGDLAPAAMVLV
jgi:hypothetical protein